MMTTNPHNFIDPHPVTERALSILWRLVRETALCLGLVALFATAAKAQAAPTSLPVIVADFNHDGIPDALVQSATSPTATIALGSIPYGSFGTVKAVTLPATCTTLPAGSLLVGDFNGDGFPDLAFLCGTSAGISLGNGDGTFGAVKALTGVTSTTAVVGDFNKDGKLDLVLLSTAADDTATQSIQFLAGNGDGTFAAAISTALAAKGYSSPIAADLNADGFPDLVLGLFTPASGAGSSVNVFGNNQNGTFGTITGGVGAPSVAPAIAATAPGSILIGNFFGTGAVDLAVTSTGTDTGAFYLLANTSTATAFSFSDPVTIASTGLQFAAAGSFTGSGFTDLVAANGTTVSVLANDGAGNFTAAYSALTLTSPASKFAVADANSDGYADLYTATLDAAGALQLAVDLTTGSATATSLPVTLGIGTRNISAAWNGNVNFTGATATGSEIVAGATSSTTLVSSRNPSIVGDSVTFTAIVKPSSVTATTPTGTVILSDGATTLGSGPIDATGTFAYTATALTQASHPIVAAYSGDGFYAPSTSAILTQIVNHAAAVASTINWATPAPIVYGAALSAAQLNATAVDTTGAPISGTFAYTPASGTVLDAGSQALSVTFTPTDALSFLPATRTVALVITKAAPVIAWPQPAGITYGTALGATQLDATATGVTGAALPGVFTYTPAAGSVPAPGADTLSVSFAPTNALDYATATGTVTLNVTGVSLTSISPNSAMLDAPDTRITLTGSGFVAGAVIQINGTAVATAFVNTTSLTATIPAADLARPGALQITVTDPGVTSVSAALPFTVTAPPVGATLTGPSTAQPGSQPTLNFTLAQVYPVDIVATLTLGFVSSTTPSVSDPAILFANGTNTLTFTIAAGTVTVPTIQLQSGTVTGTITIPITLTADSVDVTPATLLPVTIDVPATVPTVSSATLTRTGNQLTVVVHGFSNTREMATAKFHFTPAAGASLSTTDLSIPAGTIFNTDWFDNTDASSAYGSTFTYTQVFNLSDVAATVGSIDIVLTNTVGDSISATAQ